MYFHWHIKTKTYHGTKMKYYYLLLFVFFSSSYAIAQTNYKPGFIVTTNGETVNGYINYREWNYNPGSIGFKKTLIDKAQTFGPTDLSYFELTGLEGYKAAHVAVSMARIDLQTMKDDFDTTTVTKDVFLKLIKKGDNVSLFSYSDQVKTRYYINDNKSTNGPAELQYQAFMDPQTLTVKTKNLYNLQLIALAKKYRAETFDVQDHIVKTKFNERELKRVVAELNNESPDNKEDAMGAKTGLRYFVGSGINVTNLNYSGPPPAGSTGSSKISYFPKVTIGFDAPFNPNVGRLLFRTELSFTITNGEIKHKTIDPTVVITSTYKPVQQTISLKPQLIYNIYNADNFKFYTGAGININYSHYPASSNKTAAVNDVPSLNYNMQDDYPSTSNFWFQLVPKAGINIGRKWDVSVNYFIPTTLSDISGVPELKVTGFDVGLSYYFGK
jgi:hypothetical protein